MLIKNEACVIALGSDGGSARTARPHLPERIVDGRTWLRVRYLPGEDDQMSKNVDTVRKTYKLYNEGKFDEAMELYDSKVVYEVPGSTIGGEYKGKKQLLKFFRDISTKFDEELRFRVDNVIENKNQVVVERTSIVKSRGGKRSQWHAADVYKFRGGKIVRMRAYTDTEAIARSSGRL